MEPETQNTAGPVPLSIQVERLAGGRLVRVAGELDYDTAAPFEDALDAVLAERPGRTVVDCSQLAFCDSTGLNLLLKARAAAEEAGGELVVAGLTPIVARLFDITGVRRVFQVFPTAQDALAVRNGT